MACLDLILHVYIICIDQIERTFNFHQPMVKAQYVNTRTIEQAAYEVHWVLILKNDNT